ncbi:MAG TPA: hypothetical protein VGJ54_02035 [Streptosporangiaceae bacterium]
MRTQNQKDVDEARSHLQVASDAFEALVAAPRELMLDCTMVGGVPGPSVGLPAAEVELPWLRDWLLEQRENYPARDAVWRELIGRARTLRGDWRIVAVAMALPALIKLAGKLARDYDGDPMDVDNEILTGFLTALEHRLDLGESRLHAKLCWAGFRAGYVVRYADTPLVLVEDFAGETSVIPYLPYRHPDLLLGRAVAVNVIDADDAALITATWLENRSIEQVAHRTGQDPQMLRMRRERAGRRLAEAILDGHLSGRLSDAAARELRRRAARGAAIRAARSAGTPDQTARPATQPAADHPAGIATGQTALAEAA